MDVRLQLFVSSVLIGEFLSVESPFVIPPVVLPSNCHVASGACYSYYDHAEMTWTTAARYCQKLGLTFAIIYDSQVESILKSLLPSHEAWIGISDEGTEGVFRWTDSRVRGLTYWRSGEPSGANSKNCVYRLLDGFWRTDSCASTKTFFCQTVVAYETCPNDGSDIACPGYVAPLSTGAICYYFSPTLYTHSDAETYCTDSGASMLKITSQEIMQLVYDFMEPQNTEFWLGLNTNASESWFWNDGTYLEGYHSWGGGYPKAEEYCSFVDTDFNFQSTAKCSADLQLPVPCQMLQSSRCDVNLLPMHANTVKMYNLMTQLVIYSCLGQTAFSDSTVMKTYPCSCNSNMGLVELNINSWGSCLPAQTTIASTTIAATTTAPTTFTPTTIAPTTLSPTTIAPTTLAPSIIASTTLAPTTIAPTTLTPTTIALTTLAPTTIAPTTITPTTIVPTTLAPSIIASTTLAPTTIAPTTLAPTTIVPTTLAPTTLAPTTFTPTTLAPTTIVPTTIAPTNLAPTTIEASTFAPTTTAPTAFTPTTIALTTLAPTTIVPTTLAPTTLAPTTFTPTTLAPTTIVPTTIAPTNLAPTTIEASTFAPTTTAPTAFTPTTLAPTTIAPTTLFPSTVVPTPFAPATITLTTFTPTTIAPTTLAPTTIAPTSFAPTTIAPTTLATTAISSTNLAPTTIAPTTLAPKTLASTTIVPTTLAPTTAVEQITLAPTIVAPTTIEPTTLATPAEAPTTLAQATDVTTMIVPTTIVPTTLAPTTLAQTISLAYTVASTTIKQTTIDLTTIASTTVSGTTITPTSRQPTTLSLETLTSTNILSTFLEPTTPASTSGYVFETYNTNTSSVETSTQIATSSSSLSSVGPIAVPVITTTSPVFNIVQSVVKCPDPIRRSNSEIVEIFHFINGYATYQCKTGFTFEDGTTTRTILCIDAGNQEGFWNIQPPDCQASQCKPPEELMSHAKCERSASVNNRLFCECDSGMRFSNGQTEADMVCTDTGLWSHHSGDCMVRCPELPLVNNSHISYKSHHTLGSLTLFTCFEGHRFEDGTTVKWMPCLADGSWMDIGQCIIDTCNSLQDIVNSMTNTSTALYDTYVEVRCVSGFTFHPGDSYRIVKCEVMGVWNDTAIPDCVEIHCDHPPIVTHASKEGNGTAYGSNITYTCDQGYGLSGNDTYRHEDGSLVTTITCQHDAEWSVQSVTCEVGRCPPVPVYEHAEPNNTIASDQNTVIYICHEGYRINTNQATYFSIQCLDTQWNTTDLYCEILECEQLSGIDKAYANSTSTVYMSTVQISCIEGHTFIPHTLQDSLVLSCNASQQWEVAYPSHLLTQIPTNCSKVICPSLSSLNYTMMPTTYDLQYGSSVTYTCMNNHWFGRDDFESTIVCGKDGEWEPLPRHCTEILCPTLATWAGLVVNTTERNINTAVNISCGVLTLTVGYSFQELICLPTGHWSPDVPSCIVKREDPFAAVAPAEAKNADKLGILITAIVLSILLTIMFLVDLSILRKEFLKLKAKKLLKHVKRVKKVLPRKSTSSKEDFMPQLRRLSIFNTARPIGMHRKSIMYMVTEQDLD